MDKTYVKVNGRWYYLYRALDREGNLVDARLSMTRDMEAAQQFFCQALALIGMASAQVTTDGYDAYLRASRETLGYGVAHRTSRYKNNRIEQDNGTTRCAGSGALRPPRVSAPPSRSSASISVR